MGLWAVSAARNGKEKPSVPGSSGHILNEVASNLRITKSSRLHISNKFHPHITNINSLIDDLNNDALFEDLVWRLDSMYPPSELLLEDSLRSSSSTIRSDELHDISPKPELLLQHSEKVFESAAPSVSALASEKYDKPDNGTKITNQHNNSAANVSSQPLPQLKSEFSQVLRESGNQSIPFEKPTSTKVSQEPQTEPRIEKQPSPDMSPDQVTIKRELPSNSGSFFRDQPDSPPMFASFGRQLDRPNTGETRNETSEAGDGPLKTAPQASVIGNQPRKSSSVSRSTDFFDRDDLGFLSPIKLVNGRLPSAEFPAADLSFIPIKKTINPVIDSEHKPVGDTRFSESDEDDDNSFQAIRTAIRKSFAGKTSRAESARQPSSRRDVLSDQNPSSVNGEPNLSVPIPKRVSDVGLQKVKSEQDSDAVSPQYSTNAELKPISDSRSDRNFTIPALFDASIPYFKRDTENKSNLNDQTSGVSAPITTQHSEKEHQRKSRTFIDDMLHSKAVSSNEKAANLTKLSTAFLDSSLQPVNLSPRKAFSENLRSTAISSKQTLDLRRVSTLDQNPTPRSGKQAHRTTVAGSPVRREAAANRVSKNSPHRGTNSESYLSKRAHLSVNSSRSPTRYNHQADRTNLKRASNNFVLHQVNDSGKSGEEAAFHVSDQSSSKQSRSKELPVKKNPTKTSWVNTPLLPGNQLRREIPHGSASPHQPKTPNFGKPSHDVTKRELLKSGGTPKLSQPLQIYASKLPQVSKSPTKYGTKQSHDFYLNPKNTRALRPENHENGSTKRILSSPEKRDRVKKERLQKSVADEMKTLPSFSDSQVSSRRRNERNAVPLPDAARGIRRREHENTSVFPGDLAASKRASLSAVPSFVSNQKLHDSPVLPDIPSDDEALNSVKNLKSWASSPKLMESLRETARLNPRSIFGPCPDIDLNAIFESTRKK